MRFKQRRKQILITMLNSILYSYLSTYFVQQIEKEVAYLMLFINGN